MDSTQYQEKYASIIQSFCNNNSFANKYVWRPYVFVKQILSRQCYGFSQRWIRVNSDLCTRYFLAVNPTSKETKSLKYCFTIFIVLLCAVQWFSCSQARAARNMKFTSLLWASQNLEAILIRSLYSVQQNVLENFVL